MPVWAAVAIVAAAYTFRSISRGFDFTPDMPIDVLLLAIFLGIVLLVIVARRTPLPDDADHSLTEQVEHEDDPAHGEG
jgi:hypothetical protein